MRNDVQSVIACDKLHTVLQLWLTYSPIPNLTASFYRISVDDVDWFSNSYFTASVIMGFLSIWVLDTFQLRVAVSHMCSACFIKNMFAVAVAVGTIPH